MELFNTNAYAISTNRDFELEQSTKKGKRSPTFDSAWDDGSAFPGLKSDDSLFQEGDRIVNPGGRGGVIQKAFPKKYRILWDNGHSGDYTPETIEAYGYQREQLKNSKPSPSDELERWNPEDFNLNPAFKADGEQLTIFLEETGTGEPPDPDDFESIEKYEEAWKEWENSSNHEPRKNNFSLPTRNEPKGNSSPAKSQPNGSQQNSPKERHRNQAQKTQNPKNRGTAQELERRANNIDQWIPHGKMPEPSESDKAWGVLCPATHSSNGEISGEISRVLRKRTSRQRGSSSHQPQQTGQSDRKFSANEEPRAYQTPQKSPKPYLEASEEKGHRESLQKCERSFSTHGTQRTRSIKSNQELNQGRGSLLGICLILWHWIYAQEWVQVFHLLCFASADSNLLGLPRQTNIAQTSSPKDSQKSPILETCMNSQPSVDSANDQTVLQLRHHANPSASKVSDSQRMTPETVSPQSSKSSSAAIQNSSPLKMSEVCSVAPSDQEQKSSTLDSFSGSFPAAGTMSNGSLFLAQPLERPTLEKDCFWLESPTALSSTGRAPGLSKLESSLVKLEVLSRGQVANPIFLEESFGIPQGWTDPLECQAATELLEEDARRSAMLLIQELERSPSQESSICTKSPLYEAPSESNEIPEKFSEETKKDRRRGCLYKYLENKKLKDGTIASYPRVISDRDPDNPKHWRWGFNWEEKKDGEWKGRSIGSLPVGLIPMIQSMQKSDVPLQEIIDFIRRSKGMRNK